MARHQIIYTSCMRGIDSVNDGQQIYSYDESFKESGTDDVRSLFTYQIPSLAAGILMTDEMVSSMPSAFRYKLLRDGSSAITLNTYLGRDYMGESGRFGNYLSHSIVCDSNEISMYPCELYKSNSLRTGMKYEEVNNPNRPEYLPEPVLSTGSVITPDEIVSFVNRGENLDILKKMVAGMLRFSSEKKKIIICDEAGNIIRWIAALHYVLPLEIARKVGFTTYEFDPELSSAQICGVVALGSKYEVETYIKSKRYYVFDMFRWEISDIDSDNLLMEFIDVAMSYSYDSLLDFHKFLISSTSYRNCDEMYYAAYYSYHILFEGLSDITEDKFCRVTEFVSKYMLEDSKRLIATKLIDELNKGELSNSYSSLVVDFLLNLSDLLGKSQYLYVKKIANRRLISEAEDKEALFSILMTFGDVLEKSEILPLVDRMKNERGWTKAGFGQMKESKIRLYLNEAFGSVNQLGLSPEEVEGIKSLFDLTNSERDLFDDYLIVVNPEEDRDENMESSREKNPLVNRIINFIKKK